MYKPLLAASIVLLPFLGFAETAQDYFHSGAKYYIFGDKDKATQEIHTGLTKFPDDPELQKLSGLLKKEEQKQQQNSGSQNNQDKNNREKDSKSGQDQQNQAHQKSEEEKKKEEQERQQQSQAQKQNSGDKQQQQARNQRSQAAQQDKEKAQEEAKREAEMMAAGQMTPHQAEQLLDSMKDDEHVFQLAPPNKNVSRPRSYKDW